MKNEKTVQKSGSLGLSGLVGQRVTLFCLNYIYTGRLAVFDDTVVVLEDGGIVYETGPYTETAWKDYQKFPHPVHVMLSAIESFMILK